MRRLSAGGFSLVEVILAIGILAGALVSIGSMFMLGGRLVAASRSLTRATALAGDLLSEIDSASYSGLYRQMGASATDTTRTVSTQVSGSPIASWGAVIGSRLNGGSAVAAIHALGSGTPNFETADGIRLTVEVTWSDLGRTRRVVLSTSRF